MVESRMNSAQRERSLEAFQRAQRVIPGGVNSPVRAFRAVETHPVFFAEGKGSRLYDIDGNSYIDYVCSWGPLILGHAHGEVVAALKEAAAKGTSFGAPTSLETELAEAIVEAVPSVERVRLVNSGTEATMSALRLARGYTGRSKVVKFAGCYHGHVDSLLVKAGSGATTLGVPDSPGVTAGTTAETFIVPYNDLVAVEELFDRLGEDLAAVIVEPVAGNMGVVLPQEGFLAGLREITAKAGSLLIFDEVITGFRVAYGGAQSLYGITPDLSCFGKIIGGGLPVGAYGGRADVMQAIAPTGPVYQAGTLSGNPLAVTAGLTTLRILRRAGVYEGLDATAKALSEGLRAIADAEGIPVYQTRVGSLMGFFFSDGPVTDYDGALGTRTDVYGEYFRHMLNQGVYLAPSAFEAGFVSTAHTDDDIAYTLEAAGRAMKAAALIQHEHGN